MAHPDNDSGNMLRHAFELLQAGDGAGAERVARMMLKAQPNHTGAATVLALSLLDQGRPRDALPILDQICVHAPDEPANWSNLANCMCELGLDADALIPMQQAFKLGADDPGSHFAYARALIAHRRLPEALQAIDIAIRQQGLNTDLRLLRARILLSLDRWPDANAEIELIKRLPGSPGQIAEAAHVLLQTGLYADAEQMFRHVLAQQSDSTDAQIGLGLTLERTNRLEEAGKLAEALPAITLNERLQQKIWQLQARLAQRSGDSATAADFLNLLLAKPPADPAQVAALAFDLAQAQASLGDVSASMASLELAHRAKRALVSDTHPEMLRQDSLLGLLDREIPELSDHRAPADEHTDPVFLVGFPRSGTTLLEQLLDAHPALASFDEQPFLQRVINRLNEAGQPYPDALPDLDEPRLSELRRAYFADVDRVLKDRSAQRVVDKNPLNLARAPLIDALFPNARLLLAIRHPCDVVLSCYQQNFRAPALAISFETLLSTAQMYDRVMRHFQDYRERLKTPLHVLRYEDLVDDTRGEAERLFAFLDLPWQDDLLAFTERAQKKGAISTPSYSQVIQPVNRRAVGKWHAYAEHFDGAVMDLLAPWIREFGYVDDGTS
ncbi:MAG: sulfotransferase [Ahniella sp.]|nr:sulfotransferase [Ahniella sp.]